MHQFINIEAGRIISGLVVAAIICLFVYAWRFFQNRRDEARENLRQVLVLAQRGEERHERSNEEQEQEWTECARKPLERKGALRW